MNKRFSFRGIVALAFASLAMAQAAFAAPTATVPLQVSPERATTLAVWEPAQVRGVVLFSTGHGSWPERYDGLLQAWREAGFAVVAPLHVDSMRYPEREKFSPQQGFMERLSDMKAASAYAAAHWPGVPVAAAGHSYGTLISLALGGAMADMAPLRDPSVTAVVGYSSPGRIPGLVTTATYASVAVPVLIVTGDKDFVPGFVSDAKDHLYPVETAPAGDKFAVVLAGGEHNLIGGESEATYLRARDVGTAFLRAEVLDDAVAESVLSAPDSDTERWLRR
ncbi:MULTISPECIES: alpha/beta hydrolase [unclassified Pseudoxanthomonas]|uniref:alpha/beta hydrolase family protein n=1 Tax=unclassified Pseudoxanthomonas TaxID=2645906 RepID=UPI0008E03863|nr:MULTISPECIES: alpha/beta hydrolase [unclassified Pseudoxanthomonas]PPJ43551.1 alpha/beta hydrolase [Pseudoxanthomonas sp. KAs_5_3]SFV35666.1 Serine aminopeptidase, S33 [Pseudoxanthomonas sp. YR558]